MMQPTLEQRLDALDIPRQPRASVLPGVRADATAGRLHPLTCAGCGRGDTWYFDPRRALIVCWCWASRSGPAR